MATGNRFFFWRGTRREDPPTDVPPPPTPPTDTAEAIRTLLGTQWALTRTRDYVDATMFGDTNRTYLTGEVTFTVQPVGNATPTEEEFTRIQAELRQMLRQAGLDYRTGLGWGEQETPMARQARIDQRLADAKERTQAEKVATKLLMSYLSKEEQVRYRKYHEIKVKGKTLTYVINQHGHISIEGARRGSLCVGPRTDGYLPSGDRVLAAKLFIEASEEQFLKIANYSDDRFFGWSNKIDVNGKVTPKSYRNAY